MNRRPRRLVYDPRLDPEYPRRPVRVVRGPSLPVALETLGVLPPAPKKLRDWLADMIARAVREYHEDLSRWENEGGAAR